MLAVSVLRSMFLCDDYDVDCSILMAMFLMTILSRSDIESSSLVIIVSTLNYKYQAKALGTAGSEEELRRDQQLLRGRSTSC